MSKFTGTMKELTGKLKVGDRVLTPTDMSLLTSLGQAAGFARVIGEAPHSGKGKAPKIWEIDAEFSVTIQSQ